MASLEDIKEIQAVIPKLRCNSSRGQLGDVHQDLLFLQTLVDPKPWPATEDFKRIEYKIDQIRKLTEELIQTPSQNAVAEGLLLLRSLAYSAGVRSELEWRNCPEYKRPGDNSHCLQTVSHDKTAVHDKTIRDEIVVAHGLSSAENTT